MRRKFVNHNEVAKQASGDDVLETSRSAALESAANILETLAQARKLKQRARAAIEDATEFRADETAAEPRDFLFDMLRLNASYLNELAKLGTHHKDLVRRALENLYSSASANSKHPTAANLEFDAENLSRKFIVQNDAALTEQSVLLAWEGILAARSESIPDPFSFMDEETGVPIPAKGRPERNKSGAYFVEVDVVFATPTIVAMTVDPTDLLPRKYETELVIKLKLDDKRTQVRRIPVSIDMRAKARGK